MKREQLDERLVDYLYDELDAEERRRFEEALPDHPDLQAEVAAHRSTRSAMAELGDEEMPPGLLDGVLREARATVPTPEPPGEERPGLWERIAGLLMQPAFATALLFAVVAGTGLWLSSRDGGEGGEAPTIGDLAQREPPAMQAEPEPSSEAAAQAEEPRAEGVGAAGGAAGESLAEAARSDGASGEGEAPVREVGGGTVARLVEVDEDEEAAAEAEDAERTAEPEQVAEAPRRKRAPTPREVARAEPEEKKAAGGDGSDRGYGRGILPTPSEGSGEGGLGARRSDYANAPVAPDDGGDTLDAEPPPATWGQVEEAVEAEAKPDLRARILLDAHDRFVREGREELASKALDTLESVPGWEEVARDRRAADEARRARESAREATEDEREPSEPSDERPAAPAEQK